MWVVCHGLLLRHGRTGNASTGTREAVPSLGASSFLTSASDRDSVVTSVLRIRDFRLLFTGEGVSLLGDQFYFIALPWLVLQLSARTVVLGVVLALQGICLLYTSDAAD